MCGTLISTLCRLSFVCQAGGLLLIPLRGPGRRALREMQGQRAGLFLLADAVQHLQSIPSCEIYFQIFWLLWHAITYRLVCTVLRVPPSLFLTCGGAAFVGFLPRVSPCCGGPCIDCASSALICFHATQRSMVLVVPSGSGPRSKPAGLSAVQGSIGIPALMYCRF